MHFEGTSGEGTNKLNSFDANNAVFAEHANMYVLTGTSHLLTKYFP